MASRISGFGIVVFGILAYSVFRPIGELGFVRDFNPSEFLVLRIFAFGILIGIPINYFKKNYFGAKQKRIKVFLTELIELKLLLMIFSSISYKFRKFSTSDQQLI